MVEEYQKAGLNTVIGVSKTGFRGPESQHETVGFVYAAGDYSRVGNDRECQSNECHPNGEYDTDECQGMMRVKRENEIDAVQPAVTFSVG